MENYYQILGLQDSASADEIKKAYRKLTKQYHPDKNSSPEATEKFKKIGEAYETLSVPENKVNYDKSLSNSASSNDLIFSLNTNIPSSHTSSGQEIVLNTTYSFKELLNISELSQSELSEIAKKDPKIALAIFEDKELREKMGSVYLLSLGKKYEAIAIKLVSKNEYHNKFRHLESWVYDLAISHEQACELIIKNQILAQQLNGQRLFELEKKYPNTFKNLSSSIANIIDKKISAYNFLLAYANNTVPIKPCGDINGKLEQAINDADLLKDQLAKLGKKNLTIATIICNNSLLVKKLGSVYLNSLISAHETLAVKFINDKDLWSSISYDNWVFDLAKISWQIFQTILKHAELVNQLTMREFKNLEKQYSSGLINSSITLDNRFKEKIEAYDCLTKHVKNATCDLSNNNLDTKLIENLYKADLLDNELKELGEKNLNIAKIIYNDPVLFKKLGSYYFFVVISAHELLINKIIENRELWSHFKYINDWTFKLAEKYPSVCQKILEIEELSCHLAGEQLYTLSSKHDFHITELIAKNKWLADKLKAYKLLKNIQASSAKLGKATTSNYSPKVNNGQDDFEIGKSYLTEVTLASIQRALPWFKKAAEQGHTVTLKYLVEQFRKTQIKEQAAEYALAIAEIYYDFLRDKENANEWLTAAITFDCLKKLCTDKKNNLCYKLGIDLLHEPNIFDAYHFLQKLTNPNVDILFELGNLTLLVLAKKQTDEICRVSKNKASEADVSKLLKSNENRKKRIIEALPYFLRAANQGHEEAHRIAGNLLNEIRELDLTVEQLSGESYIIILQDKTLQQYLSEKLVKEIIQKHSLIFILNKGKISNVETNQYKKSFFLLPEHIDTAFKNLVNGCPIKNLSNYEDTFLFYKGLVIEDQQDSLLKKSYSFDNKNNLLLWILNLALAGDEFSKNRINIWLCYSSSFHKHKYSNFLYNVMKDYLFQNKYSIDAIKTSLGNDIYNEIGIFNYQESENFASVLQIKVKHPTYYQTIVQNIDNELSDLQNKCFVENIDWDTLNKKCAQWLSTFNTLRRITQYYEKVKKTLELITDYRTKLEKKITEPFCKKMENYYQTQSSAFEILENNLRTILKNHYEQDFSDPNIAIPNTQIIYKDIKNAIDNFKANEGKVLLKNEIVWKDILDKVLTGFSWLLLSPVMLIKTGATHSPVFRPFKSEAEKILEQLDSTFSSNLLSAPNVASNSRDTVAFFNLRNNL